MCDILWPEVQSHSDDSPVHACGPHSVCALAQARPTMSCIHLVYLFIYLFTSGNRTPGSRSYSDPDTWHLADSVVIYQVVLQPRSKSAHIMQPASLWLIPINAHET